MRVLTKIPLKPLSKGVREVGNIGCDRWAGMEMGEGNAGGFEEFQRMVDGLVYDTQLSGDGEGDQAEVMMKKLGFGTWSSAGNDLDYVIFTNAPNFASIFLAHLAESAVIYKKCATTKNIFRFSNR